MIEDKIRELVRLHSNSDYIIIEHEIEDYGDTYQDNQDHIYANSKVIHTSGVNPLVTVIIRGEDVSGDREEIIDKSLSKLYDGLVQHFAMIQPESNNRVDAKELWDQYEIHINKVADQIEYQLNKHGPQLLTIQGWHAVTAEEFGEVAKAMNQRKYDECLTEIYQTMACLSRMATEIYRVQNGLAERDKDLYVEPV